MVIHGLELPNNPSREFDGASITSESTKCQWVFVHIPVSPFQLVLSRTEPGLGGVLRSIPAIEHLIQHSVCIENHLVAALTAALPAQDSYLRSCRSKENRLGYHCNLQFAICDSQF